MTKADGLALKDEIRTAFGERRAARVSGEVLKTLHAQTWKLAVAVVLVNGLTLALWKWLP